MDDDGGRIHPPPTLRLEVGVFCYEMINEPRILSITTAQVAFEDPESAKLNNEGNLIIKFYNK